MGAQRWAPSTNAIHLMRNILLYAALSLGLSGLALAGAGLYKASQKDVTGAQDFMAGFVLAHAAVLPLKAAELTF